MGPNSTLISDNYKAYKTKQHMLSCQVWLSNCWERIVYSILTLIQAQGNTMLALILETIYYSLIFDNVKIKV